jgi:hypothetical protein
MTKRERLVAGETITTSERGNSMLPFISSGQKHVLEPVILKDVKEGDIVYCRVKGNYYTHKVWAVDPVRGLLIGNARKYMNGWTKQVYGRVKEVL